MTALAQLDDAVRDWALRLLATSVLPETRLVETVYYVEPGAICFVTRGPFSGEVRARTALLKATAQGETVYRIIDGWPLMDAGIRYQGPVGVPAADSASA